MSSVAIIHGWAEGDWQSKRFIRALSDSGLSVTKNIKDADVIFAHSAGCYLVPKDAKAKVILLVGLPCWPGRSLASGVIRKLIKEAKYHRCNQGFYWWLNKVAHNSWYIVTKPQASYYLKSRYTVENLPSGVRRKVLVVRPSDDTLCHPSALKILGKTQEYAFIEVPGAHDDCWMQPKPYVDLVLSTIR